ncbi:LuxR C-terminal-related transcriptional regulator [Sanguibacter sp. 25GB23B1]|uniref:LuxR C-terminal-related transcriptional regulator n=1 Tax=unclassified Sanguibacter TaxID=2645534 RepID=UPI0032AF1BED
MSITRLRGSPVGRPVPLASLTAEVEHALAAIEHGRGGYIWTAPPGAGKSTLLDLVLESAAPPGPSHVVVHLQPAGGGAGAVTEHLVAQLARITDVPVPPHLAVALARPSTGERPDAACAALAEYTHTVLPGVTVVLVVDDLDLLDPASRSLLLYLVTHHQISVVLLATATRATWAVHLPYPLSLRKIPPLMPEEVLHLLRARQCPATAPRVAAALARQLSGTTACILQTAAELSAAQLAGTSLLPNPLPPVPALEAVHGATLDQLDADDHRTLLVAAVSVVDRADLLLAAAGRTLDEVLGGPVATLLHLAGGRFTVVDPSLRALVHGRASVAERTAVHLALAAAHRAAGLGDTATWHTALGSLAGDPEIAPSLVAVAEGLLGAGDVVHAHEVAREAASQSTGDERSQAQAQLVAGVAALRSGHVVDAEGWLQQVMRSPERALAGRALAPYVTAVTLHTGRVPDDDVVQHLDRALEAEDDPHRAAVVEALGTTARLHAERGHVDTAAEYLRAAEEALAALEREGTGSTDRLGTAETARLGEIVRLDAAWCALFEVDRPRSCAERTGGQGAPVADVADRARATRLGPAHVSADAHPDLQSSARALRALQHVLAGDVEAAQSSLASAVVTHAPVHDDGAWRSAPGTAVSPLAEALLRAARVVVELASADLGSASEELARASFHVPVDLPLAGIAVAAARRLDVFRLGTESEVSLALAAATPAPPCTAVRREELVDTVLLAERAGERCEATAELEQLAGAGPAPWDALLPGLPDGDGQADPGGPSPCLTAASFQRARHQLAAARVALRSGTAPAAHEQLVAAAELFGACGAEAWRDAAQRESEVAAAPVPLPVGLRAALSSPAQSSPAQSSPAPTVPAPSSLDRRAGRAERAPGAPPPRWDRALTRRELDVALLVVQGASNRDVASTLHVSVRTVEVHLGRVFRKLGARSRVELTVLAHRGAGHVIARSS